MTITAREISDLMNQIDAATPDYFKAVLPGAGIQELSELLKAQKRPEWQNVVSGHAKNRAAELCYILEDGDLIHRDGSYLWVIFWPEIDKALKAAGCRRTITLLSIAEAAFVAEVDTIRVRRLGPDLLDPDELESMPPVLEEHSAGAEP